MDNGEITGLVFVDLKEAFDTVDQSILCQKLEHYGVKNRELSLFESYLNNRRQFCRVNGVNSRIETWVPQGSYLGPLLFLLYINDFPQALNTSSVSMYADDTSLCSRSKDLTELNKALSEDLQRLDYWLQGNKLSLNVVKTKSLLIASNQKQKHFLESGEKLALEIRGMGY